MRSPPIDRSPMSLHPIFGNALRAWLEHVTDVVPHVEMRITETRRTGARQDWLYSQGREHPFLDAPTVTWTRNSRHRYGLAADLAMIRRATGAAIWEVSSWSWLYRTVPPQDFGLRHIGPTEWVHLELRYADEAIRDAAELGLLHT